MTSTTTFRIHDLPVEVLSLILGSFPGGESRHEFPFFELRLVCRLWNKIASPHLFRTVQLGRGRRTFQRWRRLLSRKRIRKHIQHVRIDCQNEYPPYHELIKWKWHFARAVDRLKDLEQLNELSIHFEKSCDLEGWREGVTSKFRSFFATGARMWILSKLAAALKERAVTVPNCRPVRSLTIYNLQNFPAWKMGSFDEPTDITFLAQSLRELDLTFVSENYTEIDFYDHGDWDPGKVKRCNFTPYLRHNWLVPTMEYLASLSISSVERWGAIPSYFDGKGLEFPKLRSLALANFVIGHHDQFNWVLRQKSLQSLYLLDNAILSYIFHDGLIKEQANIPIHDWIMLGDSQYYFPGTWEAVFDRINEELPRLKDFWFCSDAGVYPPQPGKLCHVRYISFHSDERPVWNTGARTDGDLEWDWTTNRAKETFRGDTRARHQRVVALQFCPQGYDPFLLYRASCSRGEVEEKSTQKAPRCKGEPESGAVPKLILRAIVGTIQESGIDSCAVATRHAGSLTGSTLEMTRKVVGRPRNRDTNGHIQPSSSDDTSRILCTGRDASKASLTQQVNTWKAEPPELLNCRSCRGLDAVPFQGLLFRGFIHQSGSAHPKRATANGYQYSQEASRISFESAVEATGRIARVAETAMTHGSLTDRPLFL